MQTTIPAIRRIEEALARPCYLVPTKQVAGQYREALDQLARWMVQPDFDGELAVNRIRSWAEEGVLDAERMWSALSVVCTHPRVRDYREASRCIALQESAALDKGGRDLEAALASVERHRGVLAFCMGRPEVALECFVRALERERSSENLANVMAALCRTGEQAQAIGLLEHVRETFSEELVAELEGFIAVDEDLAGLR